MRYLNFYLYKIINVFLLSLIIKKLNKKILRIKDLSIKSKTKNNYINYKFNKNNNEKNIKNKNSFKFLNISSENKTEIPISYAVDNKYIYPTIVSMTSLVYNARNNTFYKIYIMHSKNLTLYSKQILQSIENKYPNRCTIKYLNMGNKYADLMVNYKIQTPAYYRLSLPNLLLDEERIIWLDGDTLVFEDLKELIDLNMKDNLIMGFLDNRPDAIKSFGYENATVICSGVLLMDLNGLRKYGFSNKTRDFISKYKSNLTQHDQTIINVITQKKIGVLPPKYGIWDFKNITIAKKHLEIQKSLYNYNQKEFFYALKHPSILHFVYSKPFWRKNTIFDEEWWKFAISTGFFYNIYSKSPIPSIFN